MVAVTPARPGSEVKLYYDGEPVTEGDYLRTANTGRLYEVLEVRVQTKGEHVGRQHLRCLVTVAMPDGATVHPVHWYPRNRRRSVPRGRSTR